MVPQPLSPAKQLKAKPAMKPVSSLENLAVFHRPAMDPPTHTSLPKVLYLSGGENSGEEDSDTESIEHVYPMAPERVPEPKSEPEPESKPKPEELDAVPEPEALADDPSPAEAAPAPVEAAEPEPAQEPEPIMVSDRFCAQNESMVTQKEGRCKKLLSSVVYWGSTVVFLLASVENVRILVGGAKKKRTAKAASAKAKSDAPAAAQVPKAQETAKKTPEVEVPSICNRFPDSMVCVKYKS